MTLTVTLSVAASSTVTVAYSTAGGTATAGSDYQAKTGTLTFVAGVRTQTFTVTVVGDKLNEPNETILVTLSNATNATIARDVATVTLLNDEKALTVSRSAPQGHEATPLTSADLDAAVAVATANWLTADPVADFSGVSFAIAELPDDLLGLTDELTITIDATAAGWGWGPGSRRVDLVTVIMHELGHVLGHEHGDEQLDHLMDDTLAPGTSLVESLRTPPDQTMSPRAVAPRLVAESLRTAARIALPARAGIALRLGETLRGTRLHVRGSHGLEARLG